MSAAGTVEGDDGPVEGAVVGSAKKVAGARRWADDDDDYDDDYDDHHNYDDADDGSGVTRQRNSRCPAGTARGWADDDDDDDDYDYHNVGLSSFLKNPNLFSEGDCGHLQKGVGGTNKN